MALAKINERSTTTYTVMLNDEDGNPVLTSAMVSLTLTFCTTTLGTEINGRTDQNILNANDVTYTDGAIVWDMQQIDNAIIDGAGENPELHLATFSAVWNTDKRKTWTVEFQVTDLSKITT